MSTAEITKAYLDIVEAAVATHAAAVQRGVDALDQAKNSLMGSLDGAWKALQGTLDEAKVAHDGSLWAEVDKVLEPARQAHVAALAAAKDAQAQANQAAKAAYTDAVSKATELQYMLGQPQE